ncbi:MAG: hypothetical protein ABIF87_09820 [Pseudomonadota bacterium]
MSKKLPVVSGKKLISCLTSVGYQVLCGSVEALSDLRKQRKRVFIR